jgi:hypothetical protein
LCSCRGGRLRPDQLVWGVALGGGSARRQLAGVRAPPQRISRLRSCARRRPHPGSRNGHARRYRRGTTTPAEERARCPDPWPATPWTSR